MDIKILAQVRFNYIASHIASEVADWIRVNSFDKFKCETGFSKKAVEDILLSKRDLSMKEIAKIAVTIDKAVITAFPDLEELKEDNSENV